MSRWLTFRPYLAGAFAALLVAGAVSLLRASGPRETPIVIEKPTAAASMAVFVGGAVVAPGVYTLPTGERVDAAIAAAGGLAPDADPDAVNRALKLRDQAQVIVPRKGIPRAASPAYNAGVSVPSNSAAGTPSPSDPLAAPAAGGRINVNTAPASVLEQLPGVGPSLAARIIEYRDANGEFRSLADLAKVRGISERMTASWADLVSFNP